MKLQTDHAGARQIVISLPEALCVLLLTIVFVPAGCRDATGRQKVTGEVSFNGEPLPSGEISLRPFDTGPSAAGRVKDGKFELPSGKGPMPGKYLVRIESLQPTGKKVRLAGTTLQVDQMKQVLPNDYNEASQLVIEVTGDGENHFDFDLKSE